MQPEMVAQTLSHVEDEWWAQAAVFAECDGTSSPKGSSLVNCADAPSSFSKSCQTVVTAIVQGSGGDKDTAKEYMADVCSQHAITGWHQDQCNALALAVIPAMNSNSYSNRMAFNAGKLCTGVWSRFLEEGKQRLAKEKSDHEATEKKANDDMAQEQQQEVQQQAEREQARKASHQKTEAEAQAAESKAKAIESVLHVAEKKLATDASVHDAKQTRSDVNAVEKNHKDALANSTKGLKNKVAEAKAPEAEAATSNNTVVAKPAKKTPAAPKPANDKVISAAAVKPAAAPVAKEAPKPVATPPAAAEAVGEKKK